MPDALVVLKGLWIVSLALQAALVLRILEKNLIFGFLWFAGYLAVEVATGLALVWTPLRSNVYVQVWGISQPILVMLQVGAAWELIRRLLMLQTRQSRSSNYAVWAAVTVAMIAAAVLAFRIEQNFFRESAWQVAIVLFSAAAWIAIAVAILALWVINYVVSRTPPDRNTMVHARLLFALAAAETLRYVIVAWSHGALVSVTNLSTVIVECVLFLLWILLLKDDLGPATLHQSARA